LIKLTEILQDILAEKKLCPKGKAYYNRRRAAGEKPSAYLSGRAVKVCKGLMEEGKYDDMSNFDLVKQNPFDIKKLVNKGIIFVSKPGDGKGGVGEPNWEGDASIITLYNMANAAPWMKESIKTPMPQAIPYVQKDQDKLFYNGKYNQILWSIEKKGLKPEDFYLNTNEGLEDTSWTNDKDQTVTLKQLLDVIKNYPIIQAPIEKIKKVIIRKDTGGIESDRLSTADVKYPIIIVVDDSGNYKYVLDGNHRANKAIDTGLKSIPAKLVNIKKLPQEFQDILGESLRDWFKKEDWVRIDTAGNITGPCGTMKKGKKTTRCLPRAKANSLTKAERAATSKKKAASDKQFVSNTKKAKVHLNK